MNQFDFIKIKSRYHPKKMPTGQVFPQDLI